MAERDSGYILKLTDVFGNKRRDLDQFSGIRWAQRLDGMGVANVSFAPGDFPQKLFTLDDRLEIWRKVRGRVPRLVFVGFLRGYAESGDGYSYAQDYEDELTFVYAGGQGQAAARTFTNASDAERIAASVINRREGFVTNTNTTDTTTLQDDARDELREYRYRDAITRVVEDGAGGKFYGQDYSLGDVVTIKTGTPDEVTVTVVSMLDLLMRRVVAYAAESSESAKSGPADDVIKEYVDENLLNATDTDRNLPAELGFKIDASTSSGPVVKHSSVYGNLLNVCQRVAEKAPLAASNPAVVRFGIVMEKDAGGRLIPVFKTSIGQWGQDKSSSIIFGNGPLSRVVEVSNVGDTGRGIVTRLKTQ